MAYDEENVKNEFKPSWDVWRRQVGEAFDEAYEAMNDIYNAIYDVNNGLRHLMMYTHNIKLSFPDYGNVIYLRILTASDKAYNVTNVDTAIAACGSATSPIPCTGAYKHTELDTYHSPIAICKESEQTLSRYTLTYLDASTGIVETPTFLPVVSDTVFPAFTPPEPIS